MVYSSRMLSCTYSVQDRTILSCRLSNKTFSCGIETIAPRFCLNRHDCHQQHFVVGWCSRDLRRRRWMPCFLPRRCMAHRSCLGSFTRHSTRDHPTRDHPTRYTRAGVYSPSRRYTSLPTRTSRWSQWPSRTHRTTRSRWRASTSSSSTGSRTTTTTGKAGRTRSVTTSVWTIASRRCRGRRIYRARAATGRSTRTATICLRRETIEDESDGRTLRPVEGQLKWRTLSLI